MLAFYARANSRILISVVHYMGFKCQRHSLCLISLFSCYELRLLSMCALRTVHNLRLKTVGLVRLRFGCTCYVVSFSSKHVIVSVTAYVFWVTYSGFGSFASNGLRTVFRVVIV